VTVQLCLLTFDDAECMHYMLSCCKQKEGPSSARLYELYEEILDSFLSK
jgi:hypothetical protein